MSIADIDRFYITQCINTFIINFQKTIKVHKASALLQALYDIEECIDDNIPGDLNEKLPKLIEQAKSIINSSPQMKSVVQSEKDGKLIQQEYDVNKYARIILDQIESCTPPNQQFPTYRKLSFDSRNESSDSLTSTTACADEGAAPMLVSYKSVDKTMKLNADLELSGEQPCKLGCSIC